MYDRPLLRLMPSDVRDREKRKPLAPPRPHLPAHDRQLTRMAPRFTRLQEIMERDNPEAVLQDDPNGIAPERTLVFEVAGSVDRFSQQARACGFDFLGELEDEFAPDDDFYMEDKQEEQFIRVPGDVKSTLYLIMPDLQALKELLSLWKHYKEGSAFDRGKGAWKNIFQSLHNIRIWDAQDRLTDTFTSKYAEWLNSDTERPFRFEIDAWYTNTKDKRKTFRTEIKNALAKLHATVLDEAEIEEIRYSGFLAELPENIKGYLRTRETFDLADEEHIMYLNAQVMTVFKVVDPSGSTSITSNATELPTVAALLDGFPLSGHQAIKEQITIDDFLDIEPQCPAGKRQHGTAMASLIIHGDLHAPSTPINSKLLVLPVMVPDPTFDGNEILVPNKLVIDTIYRAVKRIKEGEKDLAPPSGQNVVIINHSLGDANNPYNAGKKKISAWGRLLDYLAYRYRILFVVSAGNHENALPISGHSFTEFDNASPDEKEKIYFQALLNDMRNRALLPPAEALNPIVVGAWHGDESSAEPQASMEIPSKGGPSIFTAIGLGYKRAIKPDIYYDGGRALSQILPDSSASKLQPRRTSTTHGQKVALPSDRGEIDRTGNSFGTSNAAALITHNAIELYEILKTLESEDPNFTVPFEYQAVLLKALLAHGSNWRDIAEQLNRIIPPQSGKQHQQRYTNIARLLGFGRPDINRVKNCTRHRATLLAWGTLECDKTAVFNLPLPDTLSKSREPRTLTSTLAWFTPVNVNHQQYRQAVLEMKLDSGKCGTKRESIQPPAHTVNRGTISHQYYTGNSAVDLSGGLEIIINCREQAGKLDDDVPYALVVSFEVESTSQVDVYTEIRQKLALRVQESVHL